MKKLLLALLLIGSYAKADSISLDTAFSDHSKPAYGGTLSIDREFIFAFSKYYISLENLATEHFETDTSILSAGIELGPINIGALAGGAVATKDGTVTGLLGGELGFKVPLFGKVFVKENNRLFRSAGALSSGQADIGLGLNF